jgi:peptidoglycan hydrolase CwlO-like protein
MAITRDELYKALGGKLKPIQQGIDDIKKQLGAISNIVDDLDTRLKEIEAILKGKKAKVP